MTRNSTLTVSKLQENWVLTRVAGILALGFSTLLQAIVLTPVVTSAQALLAPLFVAAAILIGAGLQGWRHERHLESVVLVAFGLLTCSQISQLGNISATSPNSPAQGAFLLFWGIFAALVAAQQSDCGRPFHLLLAAVATTLVLKALVVMMAWSFLGYLLLLAGVVAFALAILVGICQFAALRS